MVKFCSIVLVAETNLIGHLCNETIVKDVVFMLLADLKYPSEYVLFLAQAWYLSLCTEANEIRSVFVLIEFETILKIRQFFLFRILCCLILFLNFGLFF